MPSRSTTLMKDSKWWQGVGAEGEGGQGVGADGGGEVRAWGLLGWVGGQGARRPVSSCRGLRGRGVREQGGQ